MARFVLASLLLAQILLFQATAIRSDGPKAVLVRTGDKSNEVLGRSIEDPPSSSSSSDGVSVTESSSQGEDEAESSGVAQAPEIGRLGRRHSSDKSVAGGGVIIGGLVTAIFAAVYCYIRVTKRRADDDKH